MVLSVPVPEILAGLIVHVPDVGKPLSETLPVATVQVGCTMIPITGGFGFSATVTVTELLVAVLLVQFLIILLY
jgi:hypothetical protein